MSTIKYTDEFIINRDNQTYKIAALDVKNTVIETDLIIVSRDDVTYKAPATLMIKPPDTIELNGVTLYEEEPLATRFTDQTFIADVDFTETTFGIAQLKIKALLTGAYSDPMFLWGQSSITNVTATSFDVTFMVDDTGTPDGPTPHGLMDVIVGDTLYWNPFPGEEKLV